METTERVQTYELNQAIRHICRNSAAEVGPGYFPAIAKDLGKVLGCDYAFAGELVESCDAIETLAVWARGAPGANMRYELQDTPCKQVVGQRVCVHRDGVAGLFPKDQMLIEMGVRGYIGVPVYGADGQGSGLLVALYLNPIPNEDFATSVMTLFAGRTGAELDRLRAIRRAEELEKQALQAQKLESLGVLAGGLAHDFNNVLSSILGSADLARLELPTGHSAHDHLSTIQEASSTAASLCRQLLAYAGKGRFQVVDTRLSDVVRSQDRLLQASIAPNVTLQLELSDDAAAVVRVDRGQIGQILLNLVINASEAIGETGHAGLIRIKTGVMECDATCLRTTYLEQDVPAGPYVFLEVTDNGPGMSEEVRERLFDPFFTTKFAGRGLGLAAILGITRSHSGTIKLCSEPGQGTSIRVLFPLTDAVPTPSAPTNDGAPWRGSGTVLLVDDNRAIRSVGTKMLRAIGFDDVLTAEDGVAALEVLTAHEPGGIRLVILDLTMPRMNGEQAFREMRALQPDLPIVLSSGFSEQVQRFDGEQLSGFLEKPFQLTKLRSCLEDALDISSTNPAD